MFTRYLLIVLLSFVCLLLVSCTSQIPVATNYPYTEQQKMQAAHHLDVLAAEVIAHLKQNSHVSEDTALAIRPKFYIGDHENSLISPASDKVNTDYWITQSAVTPLFEFDWLKTGQFKRAYQNYLTKHLVEGGYNVVDNQSQAELLVVFDMQLVKHNERKVRRPHIISQLGRILSGGLDGAYEGVRAGRYEAVITTSVKNQNSYLMCHIGTYYIDAARTPSPRWAF